MNVKRYMTMILLLVTAFTSVAVGNNQTALYKKTSAQDCRINELELNQDVKDYYYQLVAQAYYKPSINLCTLDKSLSTDDQIKEVFKSTGDYFTNFTPASESNSSSSGSSSVSSSRKIGIRLGEDESGVMVEVVTLNGAGDKAGIKEGDYIIEYNSISTENKSVSEVSKILAGADNAKMKVKRNSEVIELQINKEIAESGFVHSKLIDGVLVIQLEQFEQNIGNDIEKILKSNKVDKGIILDLRFNPGGYVNETGYLAEILGDSSTVGYFKDSSGEKQTFEVTNKKIINKEVKTLINQNSASASEMFAGYMKDGEKTKIYGTRSFGKGSRHSIAESEKGDTYQITDALFQTPAGNDVNDIGITPTNITKSNQALNEALKDFKEGR